MWFITLIVLALAAFFIIKAAKAHASRQAEEQKSLENGQGAQIESNSENSPSTIEGAPSAESPLADTSSASQAPAAYSAVDAATATMAGSAAALAANAASESARSSGSDNVQSELNTGDNMRDIQEMMKILNLAESDAGRLDLSREQFNALRKGDAQNSPSEDTLPELANRLRNMIA